MSLSSPIPAALHQPALTVESLRARIDGLWQALDTVTDPRHRRGVRYRLPLLLALAVLAVAAGSTTFVEIAEYAADLPVWLLTEFGVCSWSGTPSCWTFARVLAGVDHDELDQALSDSWIYYPKPPKQDRSTLHTPWYSNRAVQPWRTVTVNTPSDVVLDQQ